MSKIPVIDSRKKSPSSSDDEHIDFSAVLPYEDMVPFDFEFPKEHLLQPIIDDIKNGKQVDRATITKVDITVISNNDTSPTNFHFHDSRRTQLQKEFMQKMQDLYDQDCETAFRIPKEVLQKNMPVVVKSGGSYARGYFVGNVNEKLCNVKLVDFTFSAVGGGFYQADKSQLFFVHRELAKYPVFVFRGKLYNAVPMKSPWSRDAMQAFQKLCMFPPVTGILEDFESDDVAVMKISAIIHHTEEDVLLELQMRRFASSDLPQKGWNCGDCNSADTIQKMLVRNTRKAIKIIRSESNLKNVAEQCPEASSHMSSAAF